MNIKINTKFKQDFCNSHHLIICRIELQLISYCKNRQFHESKMKLRDHDKFCLAVDWNCQSLLDTSQLQRIQSKVVADHLGRIVVIEL